jgi:hypothetical protein
MSASTVKLAPKIFAFMDGLNPAVRIFELYCSQLLDDECCLTWFTTVSLTSCSRHVHCASVAAGRTTSGMSVVAGSIFDFSSHISSARGRYISHLM